MQFATHVSSDLTSTIVEEIQTVLDTAAIWSSDRLAKSHLVPFLIVNQLRLHLSRQEVAGR